MAQFQAALVEGLFFWENGTIHIEKDGGERVALATVLQPLVGHRVQFALHHLPPHGLQSDQPGAGSCRFPGGVGCPVQHDQHPDRMLAFHLEGVLQADPWRLLKFDGSIVAVPVQGMPGHYGRVAGATVIDVDAMRDALNRKGLNALPTGLDAAELGKMLEQLRRKVEL